MVQIPSENSKLFWGMSSGRLKSPSLSKDKSLKNIGHSMSIRNLIFGFSSVTVSYLIRYDSLLQNATVITKCDNFIKKCNVY